MPKKSPPKSKPVNWETLRVVPLFFMEDNVRKWLHWDEYCSEVPLPKAVDAFLEDPVQNGVGIPAWLGGVSLDGKRLKIYVEVPIYDELGAKRWVAESTRLFTALAKLPTNVVDDVDGAEGVVSLMFPVSASNKGLVDYLLKCNDLCDAQHYASEEERVVDKVKSLERALMLAKKDLAAVAKKGGRRK